MRLDDLTLNSQNHVVVVYDGSCPFCKSWVQYKRIADHFGELSLVNAREYPELNAELLNEGFDLDDGILVIHKGRNHFGAHGMSYLSSASGLPSIGFNALIALVFKKRLFARLAYPFFRFGRNAILRILGIAKLNPNPKNEGD